AASRDELAPKPVRCVAKAPQEIRSVLDMLPVGSDRSDRFFGWQADVAAVLFAGRDELVGAAIGQRRRVVFFAQPLVGAAGRDDGGRVGGERVVGAVGCALRAVRDQPEVVRGVRAQSGDRVVYGPIDRAGTQ